MLNSPKLKIVNLNIKKKTLQCPISTGVVPFPPMTNLQKKLKTKRKKIIF